MFKIAIVRPPLTKNLYIPFIVALVIGLALPLMPLSVAYAAGGTFDHSVVSTGSRIPGQNGGFTVLVFDAGTWQVVGRLFYDEHLTEQRLDLSHLSLAGPIRVRITHTGDTAAHIDAIQLGDQSPYQVGGTNETTALALQKLTGRDYDVIDAQGKTLTFTFDRPDQAVLALTARIEPERISQTPFQFPFDNLFQTIDQSSTFYTYIFNSRPGRLTIDGNLAGENLATPFFKEFSRPTTGHPAAFTYGWVRNDAQNLYVAIDFVSDNTMDGHKDYAKVYVNTPTGLRVFKASVPEQHWGQPGFTYTPRAVYQHKVYEFKIPLSELGLPQVRPGEQLQLAFAAYGTAAVGPNVDTTKTDNTNQPVNPGDTITYTIVITNTGDDATGVTFSDTLDANTSLVSGSLKTSPLAYADGPFEVVGNTCLITTGLTLNDVDLDGGPVTITAFAGSGNTAQGGDVTLDATGAFTYTPKPGFEGVDTFTYTLTDDEGQTDTGTVNLTVTGMIWFIDNSKGAGDGRLNSPFNTLAAFEAVNGNGGATDPAAGDNIFVYRQTATNYTGGVTLENNQRLIGQGATPSLESITGLTPSPGCAFPSTGGISPTLENTGGHVIEIEDSNTIAGFFLNSNSTVAVGVPPIVPSGIFGNGDGGTTVIDEVSITTSSFGNGVALINQTGTFSYSNGSIGGSNVAGAVGVTGGSGAIDFNNITINKVLGGVIGIGNRTGGSVSFRGGSIAGSSLNPSLLSLAAIDLQNNVGGTTITFENGFNISTTSGAGLAANNAGTVNIGGTSSTINATGGAGVDVVNTSLGSGWTFAGVSSSGSSGRGINLAGISTGSFTANDGAIGTATGEAFRVSGGNTAIAYAGTINNTSDDSVDIQSRTGGTVTLSGNINDTGTGITLANNSGGSTTFSGGTKTVNTGANTAVNLTSNNGHTINFTNGGLNIDTTTAIGFNATGGGTVNVTTGVSANTIDSTTGTALNVNSTTIGASGLTFRSISANGGSNGIVLNTTGSNGGLTVTGDGSTAGSGGTIQNMVGDNNTATAAGDGIRLVNTQDVSLSYMNVNTNGDDGIYGDALTNFSLINSTVSGNGNNAAADEAGLRFENLLGTSFITNSTISNSYEDNIRMTPDSGTGRLTFSGSTVGPNPVGTGNNGVTILTDVSSSADLTVNLLNSTFTGNQASGFLTTIRDTSSFEIYVNGTTFQSNNIGLDLGNQDSSQLKATVLANTFLFQGTDAMLFVTGSSSTALLNHHAKIQGNNIGNGTGNSGAGIQYGIHADLRGNGNMILDVSGNTIKNTDLQGLWLEARLGSGRLDAAVLNNTVFPPDDDFSSGFARGMQVQTQDSNTGCFNIQNNESQGNGSQGYRVREISGSILLQNFNTNALTTLTNNGNTTGGGAPTVSETGTFAGATCNVLPF